MWYFTYLRICDYIISGICGIICGICGMICGIIRISEAVRTLLVPYMVLH